MVLILSAILVSIVCNLDNVVVGIAYGIKKAKIGSTTNIIIASVTAIGTLVAMCLGTYIAKILPISIANILGALGIITLGVYFLIQSIVKLIKNTKSQELALKDTEEMIEYATKKSHLDNLGDMSLKEAFILALGLTLNNLGAGIAASITGVSIKVTVVFTFMLSIAGIRLGELIGNQVFGKLFGKYAPMVSGILLIILGIMEIIN